MILYRFILILKINLLIFVKIFTYSIMSEFDSSIRNALSFLNNQYVNVGVCASLAVYSAFLAPEFAKSNGGKLMNNKFVLLALLVAVGLVSRADFTVALLLALAVVMTMFALTNSSSSVTSSRSASSVPQSYMSDTSAVTGDSVDSVDSAAVADSSDVASAGVDNANSSADGSGEDYEQVDQANGGYSDSASYASA